MTIYCDICGKELFENPRSSKQARRYIYNALLLTGDKVITDFDICMSCQIRMEELKSAFVRAYCSEVIKNTNLRSQLVEDHSYQLSKEILRFKEYIVQTQRRI
jgi:hypothetical protein